MRMVATLGGFLGRKGDDEPGAQTLWLGLQRLDDISFTWRNLSEVLTPTVSSNREYRVTVRLERGVGDADSCAGKVISPMILYLI